MAQPPPQKGFFDYLNSAKDAAIGAFKGATEAVKTNFAGVAPQPALNSMSGGSLAKMLGVPCERKGYTCTGAREFKATRRRKKKGTRRR
jgi:hypothetical protein